jgi:hypothetical protein
MATTPSNAHTHRQVFRGFDESVERMLGADMTLIYGMAVPILLIVGMIIVLALSPATWLVAAIVILEIAALAVVVIGFVGMLNEDDEHDATPK